MFFLFLHGETLIHFKCMPFSFYSKDIKKVCKYYSIAFLSLDMGVCECVGICDDVRGSDATTIARINWGG